MTRSRLRKAFVVLAFLNLLAAPRTAFSQLIPIPLDLVSEYKTDPIGIDVKQPRLSWKISTNERGWRQSAYQVQVAASADDLRGSRAIIWDSGKLVSAESVHREYAGPEVRSSMRYFWRVRVWDSADQASSWSDTAYWEMGLLDAADWTAQWITPDSDGNTSTSQPAVLLRGIFDVDQTIRSARAYVTSRGLYEVAINGRRVGDELFTPGWTAYHKRIQYQTYDVTEHVRQGGNAVGVTLGDGWYRGVIGFSEQRNYYGDRLGLLLQIRIEYDDGQVDVFGTDEQWRASTGPIRMSDIYMGEVYDARLERPGWTLPGYTSAAWQAVRLLEGPQVRLVAPAGPPVRRVEEIQPVEVIRTPNGDTVFDLGQNIVGWVKLTVDSAAATAGDAIVLRHAEVLDGNGNLYVENLRTATQRVEYILAGDERRTVFEPHFTFQGFRYVAVEGYPGELTLDDLTGVVIHSDMANTGKFEVSNEQLNQLQHNIQWGQKGNFLDVPTDCPQRDERMGWTGDAQVFCRTAGFNMQVAPFFTKWLGDVAADQYANGSIPWVVPDVLTSGSRGAGATGWADAGIIIPWTIYLVYGDERILEAQYDSMRAWVAFMRERAGEDLVWTGDFHFGDWLAYATTDPAYPGATTGTDGIATAFFAHSTGLLAKMARILGRHDDARRYDTLRERIVAAYRHEFVTETGRVAENTQTAYVLALHFDLLPASLRAEAARRLVADIRARENHLTTGFLGTPYLLHVLTRFGYVDVAYDLLLQDTYPSWLYPVTQGATTIWERWDGQRPDGSFQDPGMNSFNHYAYGAVGDWMYQVVAGLDANPEAPGYRHARIQPQPGGGLTYAKVALETMYGRTESDWELTDSQIVLRVVMPPNTTATVRIPEAVARRVNEHEIPVGQVEGVTNVSEEDGDVVVEIGSGAYLFVADRR